MHELLYSYLLFVWIKLYSKWVQILNIISKFLKTDTLKTQAIDKWGSTKSEYISKRIQASFKLQTQLISILFLHTIHCRSVAKPQIFERGTGDSFFNFETQITKLNNLSLFLKRVSIFLRELMPIGLLDGLALPLLIK